MRETFTFDRADRMSDILNGVAAAVGGLIEYEWLACASWSLSIARRPSDGIAASPRQGPGRGRIVEGA
jgi:hypothetical protein